MSDEDVTLTASCSRPDLALSPEVAEQCAKSPQFAALVAAQVEKFRVRPSAEEAQKQLEVWQAFADEAKAQEQAERERLGAEQHEAKQRERVERGKRYAAAAERLEALRPKLEDDPAYRGPARTPLPSAPELDAMLRRSRGRGIVQVSLWIPRQQPRSAAPCAPAGGTRRLTPGRPRAGRRVATRGSPGRPSAEDPEPPLLSRLGGRSRVVRAEGRTTGRWPG